MLLPTTSTRSHGRTVAALLAVLVLVVAACGSDDSGGAAKGATADDEAPIRSNDADPGPEGTSGTADPTVELAEEICGYFNPRGITEIVGESVTEPRLRGSTCAVRGVDSASTALVSVEVTDEPGAYEQKRESLGVDEELPDIAEGAFLSDTTVVVHSGEMVMVATAQADEGGDAEIDTDDVIYLAELLANLVF